VAANCSTPAVHLDGPLQITFYGPRPTLTLGRHNDLTLAVGSAGQGPGTLAMLVYLETIPAKANPRVEITWPGAKTGDRPFKELYELKERC
jgi:hypothetical protein